MPTTTRSRRKLHWSRQAFDAAYLDRLRGGDHDTERHFAAYFGELILIKVRARRCPYPLPEDVRQETFLRVLRILRSTGLRDPGSLGAFVNSVCNNVILELARAQGRHPPVAEEPEPAADPCTPSPEARLLAEEESRAVRRIIEALPSRDRRLLRALYLEEREKTEVCQELGVDRNYLRVLLHRAKNQFRTAYLDREPRPGIAGPGDDRELAGGSAGC